MLKNHLKIAWRKLKADRMFSILNILGLAIGLAITILLFLFVNRERSFDTMYAEKDNIYRVLLHTDGNNGAETWCNVPPALGPALQKDLPEVKYAARMLKHDFGTTAFIKAENENFLEKYFYWCDSEFFRIFDIPFVAGNPETALSRPNTVVLSESCAKRYFGDQNAIGKTITLDDKTPLEVTGVFKDLPDNTTLDCNVIGSFSTTIFSKHPVWSNASFETYCLLAQNATQASAESKISALLEEYTTAEDRWFTFSLQPLEKVHLYSATYTDSYSSRNGDIQEIRNLSILAILILVIACINYMNLTTARAQKRAKEVRINKTLGASAKTLLIRFYIETALVTFFAIVIGIALAMVAIPAFNRLTGQQLSYELFASFRFISSLALIWLITTAIAGSYPALHLSRFSPKIVMRSGFRSGNASALIRKGLVVVQFAASVVLIVGVIVVYKQLQFIQNKNLGYNPENVMIVSTAGIKQKSQVNTLINAFEEIPAVSAVSAAQGYPGMGVSGRSLYKTGEDNGINIQTNHADAAIVNALDLKLLAGSTLLETKAEGDSIVDVLLNKKAVDYLGFTPAEAIGKKVNMQLGDNAYVRGVVEDFNFASLHQPIGAYAFNDGHREPTRFLLVRFNSAEISSTLDQVRSRFDKLVPDSAFEYSFLDKNLDRLYASEQRIARVGLSFAILAIFVACLGLFGLSAFMAEQRAKEIGIRKVLGSSVSGITRLLSIDFLKLLCLALVIAFPLAYWLMHRWLQDFAYRIHLSVFIFVIAGILALGIALLTVSFQAVKAAIANPIKSLRTE